MSKCVDALQITEKNHRIMFFFRIYVYICIYIYRVIISTLENDIPIDAG